MNNLIKAIEAMDRDDLTSGCRDEFIQLINEEMECKVLVPVEPTTEMIEAAARHCYSHCESYGVADTSTRLDAIRVYKVMLEKAK